MPKSVKRYQSYCNSHVAVDKARFSVSEDALKLVCYFFALHDASKLPRKKIKSVVDLLESEQPTQSAST